MPRNVNRTPSADLAESQIVNLDGMKSDESRLFLEVIRASIANIHNTTPISHIERKEIVFRSLIRSSLALASLYVQEYRALRNTTDSLTE